MAIKKIKLPAELAYCGFISIYFDDELCEYQVRVKGNKKATYFTDDKKDALSTAQAMRNNLNQGE